jgi:hypothetical protein
MMFHRTKEPVTVQSREEEDALGREWSRIIWPAAPLTAPDPAFAPESEPELFSEGYTESEPEEEPAPAAPTRPARNPHKPSSARNKRKG